MLGAIVGDISGSIFEFHAYKGDWRKVPLLSPSCFFTDDTVMTLAVADALRLGKNSGYLQDILIDCFHAYGHRWRDAGYGGRFGQWLARRHREPYNSFGNGSAMRISPVGWVAKTLEEAEELAAISAEVTHNHPEGVKGAQAVAGCIYLARAGKSKNEIKNYVTGRYAYNLSPRLEDIAADYAFDETCQGSVPEAIIAFLESENFEDSIKKAIWLGGDADTQAAIAGGIAEAFFGGVPESLGAKALDFLDQELFHSYMLNHEWLGMGGLKS